MAKTHYDALGFHEGIRNANVVNVVGFFLNLEHVLDIVIYEFDKPATKKGPHCPMQPC